MSTKKSKKITKKQVVDLFKENGYDPRHDLGILTKAVRAVAKTHDEDPMAVLLLLIENKSIDSKTHSYGFHTAYGRELIDSVSNTYYSLKSL